MISFYDVIGAIGACLILFGFYRTSIGRWKNKSFWYELDNFVGAGMLAFYQFHNRIYISVVLNVIWAVVAFRGLTPIGERYDPTVLFKKLTHTKIKVKKNSIEFLDKNE